LSVLGKIACIENSTGAVEQEKVYISSNGGFCRMVFLATKLFNIIH
jgi:hypothetical protein